jgi:hypothetical protein
MKIREMLDLAKFYHRMDHYCDNAISIHVAVHGKRWEIDIFDDGDVGHEHFVSNGKIYEEKDLADCIKEHS